MKITCKCNLCKKTVEPEIIPTPTGMLIGCPKCKIIILKLKSESQTKGEDGEEIKNLIRVKK